MNPVQESLIFLISTVADIFISLVLLRFLFQFGSVDYRNPVVASVIRITQVPLAVLRRFVPGISGIELAPLVLVLLIGLVKIFLISMLVGVAPNLLGAVLLTVAESLNTFIWIYIIAVIALAVMSWFSRGGVHPIAALAHQLSAPILGPIQRLLPSFGGLDFSPIVAIIALNFLQKLVVSPLFLQAQRMLM